MEYDEDASIHRPSSLNLDMLLRFLQEFAVVFRQVLLDPHAGVLQRLPSGDQRLAVFVARELHDHRARRNWSTGTPGISLLADPMTPIYVMWLQIITKVFLCHLAHKRVCVFICPLLQPMDPHTVPTGILLLFIDIKKQFPYVVAAGFQLALKLFYMLLIGIKLALVSSLH